MRGQEIPKEKKEAIVADRAYGDSIRSIAKKHKVSTSSVQKILKTEHELVQIATRKKEEETLDMLEYMDSRKEQAQNVIDKYLKALADPDKLEDATLSQIATALGIIVDKFTKGAVASHSEIEDLKSISEMLK